MSQSEDGIRPVSPEELRQIMQQMQQAQQIQQQVVEQQPEAQQVGQEQEEIVEESEGGGEAQQQVVVPPAPPVSSGVSRAIIGVATASLPEDEREIIRAILSEDTSGFEKQLQALSAVATVVGSAPQQAQSIVAPLAGALMLNALNPKPKSREVAETVAIIRALKESDSTKEFYKMYIERLEKQLEESNKLIKSLMDKLQETQSKISEKEKEELRQQIEELKQEREQLLNALEDLEKRLSEKPSGESSSKSIFEQFLEISERAREEGRKIAMALEALGLKVVRQDEIDKIIIEEAKKRGIELEKKTYTKEDVKRLLKLYEKKMKKRLEKQLEIEKMKLDRTTKLIAFIGDHIVSPIVEAFVKSKLGSVAEEADKALMETASKVAGGGQ